MIAGLVFILSAATSLLCAYLLFRVYRISRARLLMWSGICFLGLGLTNVLIYIDFKTPTDLSVIRTIPALIGTACLIYGFIMETPS